ncbi:DNA-binding SARP family transcriptional activator [Promicromonospora sp. AC04]|uniref:AfsR/SARP family transcriptional regulator n=1 Tax=Promicromonospora sp. AC04 TaxID=2135723 RepID=UPI000D339D89|nr:tetratricopeptide repeat protein [Promicromonospora sp. AC04]PUB27769.1 DNA-binding SARP family transcriptional activator [Promicromonospora sp. AC04]
MVRFQLLGHVSARSDRGPVPLGTARQRAVLAALLVEPGVPVSLDQLIERVWGATSPHSARQTLHSYISRLRSVLGDKGGPAPIRRSGGYALDVDAAAVDLHQFRGLVAQARRADDDGAEALWQDAMALWHGVPFADLDSDWLRSLAVTLEAERQAATLDHYDLLLRRGEHARLLPEVAAAAEAHSYDERLAGQLMLALYRCGRQSDALEHYRQLQVRLADELGSDPGPELRDLHQRILRHDPELAPPAGAPGPDLTDRELSSPTPAAATDRARPAQLPLDVAGFTGRDDDLLRLGQLVYGPAQDGPARTVVITAISGTAGVGKTALAVHWAHQIADQFPDGQLYVNLRGYDPDQPVRPTDALARFLTALGVPERDIPLDDDERAARYRSELAGRRMLIVLDNAGSVAQVRPLLPGSGSSLVVVTSRDSLAGLVAVHGAHQVGLDVLPATEAVDLLHRLIGDRVMAEPAAAATLAEQCARLPLALRVAAVLATSRPDRSLAEVVAELADRQERLELLDPGGDPYAAVHAVFSWSIQHLPEPAARTFRRLGLHPGPDLDPYVAAALTGLDPHQARRVLEALVRAHLLHRTGPGRYAMHDLLRAYATHLTLTEDSDQERKAAEQRLLAYYQASAVAAMDVLYPNEARYRPEVTGVDVEIPDLVGSDAARGWLETEWLCIVAIAGHADAGTPDYVHGFAQIVNMYSGEAHFADLLTINGHALRAAEHAGDLAGQAHALRQLGVGYKRLGEYGASIEHAWRALALFRQVGDLVGEARTLSNLGGAENTRGHYKDALGHHRESVAVFRRIGDRHGEALALNNLGVSEARLGDLAASVEVQQQALAIFQDLGSRFSEAVTLGNIASVEMRRARYTEAADLLQRSIAIAEEMGSHRSRANALDTLGSLHLRLRDPDRARECFQQALAHFREIGERTSQAWSINGLGEVAQFTGDPAAALALHTEALALAAADGARHQQARAHAGVGHAYRSLGNPDLARTHYEHAHVIYTELDMPDAEDMRAQLEAVPVA